MKRPNNLPPDGSVFDYYYLWRREKAAGETDGRKPRTVCLAVAVVDQQTGEHHCIILPITSTPPRDGQRNLEVPEIERARAGLTAYPRAWIMLDEYNYDIAEHSYFLEPVPAVYGHFSRAFHKKIVDAAIDLIARKTGRVDRTT